MKKVLLTGLLAGAFIAPLMISKPAMADYCREYTRTVRIGGHLTNAYGTACQQPDGEWVIVSEGQPSVARQNIVVNETPEYYDYPPPVAVPVRYYNPYPRYYYPQPAISLGFVFGGHDRWDHGGWRHR